MNDLKIQLQVPKGYQIKELTKKVDLFKACEILNSKKQLQYTKADKVDDGAILTYHAICCPYCRKKFPAYRHFLYPEKQKLSEFQPNNIKSEETILKWANIQLSLFNDINNKTITFQEPEYYNNLYSCPNCGYTSFFNNDNFDITLENKESSVIISRKIDDIKDVMEIKWLKKSQFSIEFPLFEKIVFDFNNHLTTIQLISNNNIIEKRDITNFDNSIGIGTLENLILKNTLVKRNLKRFFQLHWKTEIPFNLYELSLSNFILLTEFINYPKDFYYSIPFFKKSNYIEESFKDVSKELYDFSIAMQKLEKTPALSFKSVKRVFAKNPGLLFYKKECIILLKILRDVNLLCKIMNSKDIFQILSTLHVYPRIVDFYKDYCKVKDKISLCNQIIKNYFLLIKYAIKYSALNEFYKNEEQIKWKENDDFLKPSELLFNEPSNYSTLMSPIPEKFNDCKIDCFYFKWLRSKKEYNIAAYELDNCLNRSNFYDYPVVVVYKDSKIIAAIEVNDNEIIQARRFKNGNISKSSLLYHAIKKWCKRFSVIFDNV